MEPEQKRDLDEWREGRRASPKEEILEPVTPGEEKGGGSAENLGFGSMFEGDTGSGPSSRGPQEAGRLVDLLIEYIRRRQAGAENTEPAGEIDERTVRAILQHIRAHPLPAGLFGLSAAWLLLSRRVDTEEGGVVEETADERKGSLMDRLEEELVDQITRGYDHSRRRIGEAVQRHPWTAAGLMIAGGLLAGLLLPERRRSPGDEKRGGEERKR